MARVRSGGAGGSWGWAAVVFGVAFFICLILAILFWTQLSDAQRTAQEAQQALNDYAQQADRDRPEVIELARQNVPVVRALLDENRELKRIAVGNADVPLETIQAELQERGISADLTGALDNLSQRLRDTQGQVEANEQALQDQIARAEAALNAQNELQEQYQQQVAQLDQQIAQLRSDLENYRGAGSEIESSATQRIVQLRNEFSQQIAQLETQMRQMQTERDEAMRQLAELREQQQGQISRIAQADGVVTSVIPADGRVFINRGSNHRISPGMTFEVFDDGEVIRLPDDISQAAQSLRGKATIEVIEVRPESAVARIVRGSQATQLDRGDKIVNIAYDPNASLKFFVYGDFDITGTGEPSPADQERIENRILRWGGTLAQQLSYDVDFLVLGEEPELPEQLPPGVIDPVRIAQNVEQREKYETYQELLGEARQLNIPILNQNRFLALTGYYQR